MKLDPTVVSGCDSSAFQKDCCPRISCVALCGCVCVCEELCGACRYCALSVNRAAEVHGWRRLLRLLYIWYPVDIADRQPKQWEVFVPTEASCSSPAPVTLKWTESLGDVKPLLGQQTCLLYPLRNIWAWNQLQKDFLSLACPLPSLLKYCASGKELGDVEVAGWVRPTHPALKALVCYFNTHHSGARHCVGVGDSS